jgi:hypothetical protein
MMGMDYPEYLLTRDPAPPYEGEGPFALWHFSEDPSLGRFRPVPGCATLLRTLTSSLSARPQIVTAGHRMLGGQVKGLDLGVRVGGGDHVGEGFEQREEVLAVPEHTVGVGPAGGQQQAARCG